MCLSGKASTSTAGCACGCCGCGCGSSFRRFFSSQEQREGLENYRDQLKKELAGVKERLKKCGCK